jgi:zinc protease
MRSSSALLTSTVVAALLTGCASAPLDAEQTYQGAADSAGGAARAGSGVRSPAEGGPAGQPARAAWPVSDLKPDPGVRFGQLPNGMRYAVMRNAAPAGEASLRLRIDAGSLMERGDQLGLAHFMEHMIFNGSKNVPEASS